MKAAKLVGVRLPDELLGKLDYVCQETERTRTFVLKKAIEAYLEEYADYQIALDRWNDKDDEIISSKEMRRKLGI